MASTEASLPSPPSESASAVSLDSSIRTTPIHPDLTEIQVPGEPLPVYRYHPITCQPIEEQDVRAELHKLRQEFPSKETALRAQEQAAKEVKRTLDEAEKKKEQIQRAMDKKTKERDTEMKVLSKYQGSQSVGYPVLKEGNTTLTRSFEQSVLHGGLRPETFTNTFPTGSRSRRLCNG